MEVESCHHRRGAHIPYVAVRLSDPGRTFRLSFAYHVAMEVGGYNDVPDWPKMGPSLLIATCLIVAIRTAKWSARHDPATSDIDLAKEIEYAAHVSRRVLATLTQVCPSMFPSTKKPWYRATSEDHPE